MFGKEFPALMRSIKDNGEGVAALVGKSTTFTNVDSLRLYVSIVRRIQNAETEHGKRIKVCRDNQPNG